MSHLHGSRLAAGSVFERQQGIASAVDSRGTFAFRFIFVRAHDNLSLFVQVLKAPGLSSVTDNMCMSPAERTRWRYQPPLWLPAP